MIFGTLDGILLGLQISACIYFTLLTAKRIDRMHKDQKVKVYHEILAGALILAIWIMLDPFGIPDRASELPWTGWVLGGATAILGAGSCISLFGGDDK